MYVTTLRVYLGRARITLLSSSQNNERPRVGEDFNLRESLTKLTGLFCLLNESVKNSQLSPEFSLFVTAAASIMIKRA